MVPRQSLSAAPEGEEPRENRAYLVSLEGLKDYLPDSTDNPAKKPVRLAVLSSWPFRCSKAFTFISSMRDLNVARIQVPWKGGPQKGSQDAKESVRAAYQRLHRAESFHTAGGKRRCRGIAGRSYPSTWPG